MSTSDGSGGPAVRAAIACTNEMAGPLRQALQHDGDITVTARVTSAPTGTRIPADVLVVDVESLGEPGLELIRGVMHAAPMPVLVLCPRDGDSPSPMQALLTGAVDAIPRAAGLDAGGGLVRRRTHLVRGVGVVGRRAAPPAARSAAPVVTGPSSPVMAGGVLAVAASTGGPPALGAVLSRLVGLSVPVLVVQHLHHEFMGDFVGWLGGLSALPVAEAEDRQSIEAGHVYVAPADHHLRLTAPRTVRLSRSPATVHRPSADELFTSVAAAVGRGGVGVVLTGMGRDGAVGLLAMRRAGAVTIVQDEATSAVFGMPQAALEVGAADQGYPLDAIAATIMAAVRRRSE